MIADGTAWSLVAAAPISFVLGLVVGFILSNRFRITRRDSQ